MKNMPTEKWYHSSTGTGNLALTVKGILIGVVPVIILLSRMGGVEIGADDLRPTIDAIEGVIIAVGVAISAVMTLVGLIRKVYLRYKK